MSEIINLNQARKAKERAEKKAQAAENRRKFGRTKGEKLSEKQRSEKEERDLEGHKRETDEAAPQEE